METPATAFAPKSDLIPAPSNPSGIGAFRHLRTLDSRVFSHGVVEDGLVYMQTWTRVEGDSMNAAVRLRDLLVGNWRKLYGWYSAFKELTESEYDAMTRPEHESPPVGADYPFYRRLQPIWPGFGVSLRMQFEHVGKHLVTRLALVEAATGPAYIVVQPREDGGAEIVFGFDGVQVSGWQTRLLGPHAFMRIHAMVESLAVARARDHINDTNAL